MLSHKGFLQFRTGRPQGFQICSAAACKLTYKQLDPIVSCAQAWFIKRFPFINDAISGQLAI